MTSPSEQSVTAGGSGAVTGGSSGSGSITTTVTTTATTTSPGGAELSANLAAALRAVPSSAPGFEFVDLAAMKAAWGMPDLTSHVDIDGSAFQDFVTHSQKAPAGPIATFTVPMVQDWGWSWLDVVWEASPTVDGPPKAVYRLRDGLDMTVVVDSLTRNGFTRSGPDDRPTFRVDLAKAAGTPPFFAATVIPDAHLLVTGENADAVLRAIDDPAASMKGNASAARLLAGSPNPEYVYLALGKTACSTIADALGPSASPEAVKQIKEKYAGITDGWHAIDGWSAGLVKGTDAVVSVGFASAADASADADGRAGHLTNGTSLVRQQQYSTLYSVTASRADGEVLHYDLALTGGPARLQQMIYNRDTPWALCP